MLLTTPFDHISYKKPEEKAQRLSQWLNDNGCYNTGITLIDNVAGAISIYSTHLLQPNEAILTIPKAIMMNSKIARCSKIGERLLSNQIEGSNKKALLAAYLLQERSDANSFWQPYIQSLPNLAYLPIFFSAKELETLHGSPALELILKQRYQVRTDYNNIISNIHEFKVYSLKDYTWAYSVVNTQSLNICIDGEDELAIGPLFNIPNQNSSENISWQDRNTETIEIISKTDTYPGDELSIGGTEKSAQDYVCHYGYLPEKVPSIESRITLNLHPSEPHYNEKLIALEGKHSQQISLRSIFDKKLEHCLAQLRILAVDEEHKHFPAQNFATASTIESEIKVLNKLKSACQRSLRCYHTSIKQDQILLYRCSSQSKLRPCIQLRLQEKQLLASYMAFCEASIQILKGGCWEQVQKENIKSPHSEILKKYYQCCMQPLLMEHTS